MDQLFSWIEKNPLVALTAACLMAVVALWNRLSVKDATLAQIAREKDAEIERLMQEKDEMASKLGERIDKLVDRLHAVVEQAKKDTAELMRESLSATGAHAELVHRVADGLVDVEKVLSHCRKHSVNEEEPS